MVNTFYEIHIDPAGRLPQRIEVTVLTGRKGTTVTEGKKIVSGQHVAFHFAYQLAEFDDVSPPEVPKEANKLLAKLR